MADKTPAKPPTAAAEAPRGCWIQKAIYDQCFDQWYKDVFLQHKAEGKVGCQEQYETYTKCFMSELEQDAPLVDGIQSVMTPEIKKRWTAQQQKQAPPAADK